MPLYLFSILVAPKWVLKWIRNIQRNFLWGSTGLNRKWVRVKWTGVCLPKSSGGIALRDPLHSNNTMGARIWWKWIYNQHSPWARLWHTKYDPGRPPEELICINITILGSLIWNAATKDNVFIQAHSFSVIHLVPQRDFWKTLGNSSLDLLLFSTNPNGKIPCNTMIKPRFINSGRNTPFKAINNGDQQTHDKSTDKRKPLKRLIRRSTWGKSSSQIKVIKSYGDIHQKGHSQPGRHIKFSIIQSS